jgi:hypothetical protein
MRLWAQCKPKFILRASGEPSKLRLQFGLRIKAAGDPSLSLKNGYAQDDRAV